MQRSRGFTLIELMIVVAIIAILVALVIPSLQNARKSANETSAIGFLKMATSVNIQYRARFGSFPSDETDLFAAGYMDPSQTPNGYLLNFMGGFSSWSLQADPEAPGMTGDRHFFVDDTGVIRFDLAGPATTTSEPIGEK